MSSIKVVESLEVDLLNLNLDESPSESVTFAEETLKVLEERVNNPVHLPTQPDLPPVINPPSDELSSLVAEENKLLREWMNEQEEVIDAARRYRQAEQAHRRSRSLTSAREQVAAQIALDEALSKIV